MRDREGGDIEKGRETKGGERERKEREKGKRERKREGGGGANEGERVTCSRRTASSSSCLSASRRAASCCAACAHCRKALTSSTFLKFQSILQLQWVFSHGAVRNSQWLPTMGEPRKRHFRTGRQKLTAEFVIIRCVVNENFLKEKQKLDETDELLALKRF